MGAAYTQKGVLAKGRAKDHAEEIEELGHELGPSNEGAWVGFVTSPVFGEYDSKKPFFGVSNNLFRSLELGFLELGAKKFHEQKTAGPLF